MASHRDWLVLLLVIGCDTDEPKPLKPLCDPANPTAGRVAVENQATRVEPGHVVLFDNGLYLFVDGQCHYWVSNPNDVWQETRTGVLDAETATRLGDRLRFNAWDDLNGVWSNSNGGVPDSGDFIFDDTEHAVICRDLCDSPDVPAAVKTMRDAFSVVAGELWDRGSAVVSNVRAIAVTSEPSPGRPVVEWPLTRPITDFVVAAPPGYGQGILETDVASVQALKELRASFLRGDHGAFYWNALPVMSNGSYYLVYLRDTLPFEDANGLVPFSDAVNRL